MRRPFLYTKRDVEPNIWMARMALVAARDYLMWLMQIEGVKKGAVDSVRSIIDKGLTALPEEKRG